MSGTLIEKTIFGIVKTKVDSSDPGSFKGLSGRFTDRQGRRDTKIVSDQ